MENLALIGTILAIHVFAWFTPGPLFVLIVRNSLVYSRKSGIWTAAGIAVGNFIHITYSVAGTLLIFSWSDAALNVIKFLGVAYLTYLGIKTLLLKIETHSADAAFNQHKDISPFNATKTGFLTNILSPQASLFFASIFGSLLASRTPIWVIIFLWIIMPINSFVMASLLSMFFTQQAVRSVYVKYQNIVNKLLAAALFALATAIALHK